MTEYRTEPAPTVTAVDLQTDVLPAFSTLTNREQRVLETLVSGAGTQTAAYVAVFKPGTRYSAMTESYRFFRREDVQLALKELQTLQRAEFNRLRDQLIYSLIDDWSWDAGDAFQANGDLKRIPDMPEHVRRRITSHRTTKFGEQIEFVDRLAAKRLLIELLGIGQQAGGLTINLNLGDNDDTHAREAKIVPHTSGEQPAIDIDLSE